MTGNWEFMHEDRKKCPYCEEDIALSAKKCRFCGEWLPNEQEVPVNQVSYHEEPVTSQNELQSIQPTTPASQIEISVSEESYMFQPLIPNLVGFMGIGGTVIWLLSLVFNKIGDLSVLMTIGDAIQQIAFISVYFMIAYKLNKDNVNTLAQGICGLTAIMAFSFLVDQVSGDESEVAEILSVISLIADIVIAIFLITKSFTRKIGIWSIIVTGCFLIFAFWLLPGIVDGHGIRHISGGKIITLLVIYPVVKFFESCKNYLCNKSTE